MLQFKCKLAQFLKYKVYTYNTTFFFNFCSTWILESAGWCELKWMDVLARRAATSSCTEALIREKCWQVSFQNFCFRLQSLPAMGLLWSKRIGAPHFLAESHESTGFEAKDEQHTDNSDKSNRYWQTMADKNGRSLLFPSWPWKPCELQWMLSAGGWTEGHWEALIVADWA